MVHQKSKTGWNLGPETAERRQAPSTILDGIKYLQIV